MSVSSSTQPRNDVARLMLAVIVLGALILGSLWVLAPFLAALIWAATVVIATWPLMKRLEGAFGGRRAPAVAVMTTAMLAILVVPLIVGIHALFGLTDDARALIAQVEASVVPPAPAWVPGLPLVGDRLAAAWNEQAGVSAAALAQDLRPYLKAVTAWFAARAGTLATTLLQFLLIAILAAVLYAQGEAWAAWIARFGRRIAGDRSDRMLLLAGQSIRSVAAGIIVTAVIQTALSGLGLFIVGVPFAGILTALVFVFCIVQLGPLIVMAGATAWTFHALGSGWGTAMLAWTLVVGFMDNVVRPVLIRRGADLPLLLIMAGVIGGLLAFGVVGIFVGPVVLAVAYTLADEWAAEGDRPAAEGSESPAAPAAEAGRVERVAAG